MTPRRRLSCSALLGFVLLAGSLPARPAWGYCLTSTCAVATTASEACEEEDGCLVGGVPLYWPRRCISFSVSSGASRARGISLTEARSVIGEAFYAWTHVHCDDDQTRPTLDVYDISPVSCTRVEYASNQGNANIWTFRDRVWPYDDEGTLALTTVTVAVKTGEIMDADVEINTAEYDITAGEPHATYDLAAIATHEAGHVLGLSHSPNPDATMYAEYAAGSVQARWLHLDDVQGICSAILPDRSGPTECDPFPATGFSRECHRDVHGCTMNPTTRRPALAGLGVLLGLGLVAWRRRSAQRR